jgi:hypothetical protein
MRESSRRPRERSPLPTSKSCYSHTRPRRRGPRLTRDAGKVGVRAARTTSHPPISRRTSPTSDDTKSLPRSLGPNGLAGREFRFRPTGRRAAAAKVRKLYGAASLTGMRVSPNRVVESRAEVAVRAAGASSSVKGAARSLILRRREGLTTIVFCDERPCSLSW